jgi:hypothetical protein
MLTRGWAGQHVLEQAPRRDLSIEDIMVIVHMELGLSYFVPRGLLYSGIGA